MKTVFIIGGFDIHETAEDDYEKLKAGLVAKGYRIVPVNVSWKQKTPSQYTQEFLKLYDKHKGEYNIILGNSFGAVVALLSAEKLQPEELYLCSLSPFFKEDRGKRPDRFGLKYFGKRRMEDLWSISFDELALRLNSTDSKVTIIYGEKENETSPPLVGRCKDAAIKIKNSHLLELPNAPHDIADIIYTEGLLRIF